MGLSNIINIRLLIEQESYLQKKKERKSERVFKLD